MSSRVPPTRLAPVGSNLLLASLPGKDRDSLVARMDHVRLSRGQILWDAGDGQPYTYFPTSGLASILAVSPAGDTVAIAAVGNDGAMGWPVLFPGSVHRLMVEVPGSAYRIRSGALRRAFSRRSALQSLLLAQTQRLMAQVSRSVVCQRFHTVPQRLACWLLAVEDHTESRTLKLTQSGIARVLGIHRTDVTTAASELRKAGVVWYQYGRVVVVDRRRLEREACDCYRAEANTRPSD